jgi:tetratricopeptide (TPR) repeat protein
LKSISILLLAVIAILVAACGGTVAPPPIVEPQGDARFLIDPRTGFDSSMEPKFETAWRFYLAGNDAEAQKQIAALPGYPPATLLTAAMDIRAGRLDEASAIVSRLLADHPAWTAANMYAAEIALARNDLRGALRSYQQVANPPELAVSRMTEIRKRLFDQLLASAQTNGPDSIATLREALQIEPASTAARMLLVQKLLAMKSYDEARRELDPILNTGDVDRPDVQESLAEIEVGRGRYQEAIVRYDRLARRTNDPRYLQRLNAIKDQFAAANMPPQFQRAFESDGITRADLAVLLYWKVPSIRFAQNVGTPSIAVDLDNDVVGREEMIRAIALGIFPVDPVMRRASPNTMLTAAATARAVTRALVARGAACTREAGNDPQKVLAACGINDPMIGTTPDAPVTGRFATAMAEQIDKALK